MASRVSQVLKEHPKARLYKVERTDPSGRPIDVFEVVAYVTIEGGERRALPRRIFPNLQAAERWYDEKTAA